MGDYKVDYFVEKLFVLDDIRQYGFFGLTPVHAGRNMTSYDICLRKATSLSEGMDMISSATTPMELRRGIKTILKRLNHVYNSHVVSKHYGPKMCDYVNKQMRNASAFDKLEYIYKESTGLVQSRSGTREQVNKLVDKFRNVYNAWLNSVDSKLLTAHRRI